MVSTSQVCGGMRVIPQKVGWTRPPGSKHEPAYEALSSLRLGSTLPPSRAIRHDWTEIRGWTTVLTTGSEPTVTSFTTANKQRSSPFAEGGDRRMPGRPSDGLGVRYL